ncbi:TadE/TadG family type IV pilus assembly protein [Jiella mangrovi]|uniref:VWA domain-containing protein n=1 Tax=Jiella mangrovi TaxID=2821407 RepID=A0ABS4BCY1_9HYPH|nr:VWA domain-containing protein [Jiella mangrovi]MBP0614621.1 VWA domain-containing protein [Jiella mangrovi]
MAGRLVRDTRGNFGMMTALAAVPVIVAIGGGVDAGNVWRYKSEAQAAADSAVIVAARDASGDDTERERLADMYFLANIADDIDADVSGTNLQIENGEYIYNVDFKVETPFLGLIGIENLTVGVESVSARANIPLDIVLVLDSSGSMANDSRMVELKKAVGLFLDQFAGAESGDAKVQAALIPFDTQVRLDSTTMGTYAGTPANPYATTDCSTIADLTDRAACVAAQAIADPVIDCSKLNYNANYIDRYFCSPTRDGFELGTTNILTGCYTYYYCVTYSYTASQSGTNYVVDRQNVSKQCSYRGCSYVAYGSSTRIYSQVITTTGTTPVTTKDNDTETANNDLILTASETWSGCVIDRTQSYDVTNDPPQTGVSATIYPKANCARDTLLPVYPLTTDLTTLKTKVNQMQPSGNTNITIGVQWGMEAFTSTYPLAGANTDTRTQKVMIVLTDGNNTQNRWNGSDKVSAIDARTTKACENAKADDIEIFTIRLMSGNETLLTGCASDSDHYFPVTTASELTQTFREIAERVLRIRLVS